MRWNNYSSLARLAGFCLGRMAVVWSMPLTFAFNSVWMEASQPSPLLDITAKDLLAGTINGAKCKKWQPTPRPRSTSAGVGVYLGKDYRKNCTAADRAVEEGVNEKRGTGKCNVTSPCTSKPGEMELVDSEKKNCYLLLYAPEALCHLPKFALQAPRPSYFLCHAWDETVTPEDRRSNFSTFNSFQLELWFSFCLDLHRS